eukprot:TRINITY_DN3553_c0_g1_i3.p1 TRINITY_DN3553_c0_g1~~TRINITY_DN3553_c0_g1_i3.p1  ORF type:complete len:330 (-),score=66.26 TRINITY_DN3553_c0_g1_i3:93-1082(-)
MVKSSILTFTLLAALLIGGNGFFIQLFLPNWWTFGRVHPDFNNVVEAASENEQLSSLVAAVQAAGLVETLSDAHLEATVFAPTNKAFNAAAKALGITLDDLLQDKETLTKVLLYHVVPKKLPASHLSDGLELETLAGEDLTLKVKASRMNKISIKAIGSKADVLEADVTAGQAVVHIIDTVLLPFELEGGEDTMSPEDMSKMGPMFASIVEAAQATDSLSTLVAAVTAANLVDTLADPELEATVFAPTNEAFEAALGVLGLTLEQLVGDVETLTTVLTYHVVPVKALSTDLSDQQVLPTLAGLNLTVDLSEGVVIKAIGSEATVIQAYH